MIRKEDLEQRLKDLGWTLYKLAKQFSALRAADGDVSPATRYHTAIGKAMENPAKSKLETIEGIVQALNGELTIVWEPEQVVTIRLDDELMEVLKERVSIDGTTVNEVAKQLFQQALSGTPAQKPKKLTDLVIAEEAKIYRSFHPLIASAYSAVHQWLAERPEAEGYKELDYSKDLWRSLDKTDLKSTAFQYYTLFPRYYFESAHVLESVIHSTRLLNGLKYNPRICLVDVGCAMGAASAAFIERILTLQKDENISNPIEIVCLGIDPSIYGITLYSKLMQELKQNLSTVHINLEFQPICERVPKAIISTIRYLQKKREAWKQPIFNLFLMQLDAASSVSQDELVRREQYEKLKELGLEPDFLLETDKEFWQEEALGYKHLLEEVPVERLHIMTVGTKNLGKYIYENSNINKLDDGIQEITKTVKRVIGTSSKVSLILDEEQRVHFKNPADSYWEENHELSYSSNFFTTFCTVNSREQENDKYWNELISIENLKLAWVRARKNLLNESLYDQIEIRLFEQNLDRNLSLMQQQLIYYCDRIIPPNETIPFNFVKGASSTRPKQLSRLEEEILAAAIIKVLSKIFNLDFYSYQPKQDSYEDATEDLYENWWEGYRRFRKEVRKGAEEYQNGAVIRTDIKAYYTNIRQERILDIVKQQLEINSKPSERIDWLLRKIISGNLHDHQPELGLKQGTITSGFYANLYLLSLDNKFIDNKKWRVKFYRYVDDIIIALPTLDYVKDVKSSLKEELGILGLEINESKTEIYDDIEEFLKIIQCDNDLEKLGKRFNYILNPLWVMNSKYRTVFLFAHQSDYESLWWHLIRLYQQCLYSINIYVSESYLSRKIYKYLFKQNISKRRELNLPTFPNSNNFSVISNWTKNFDNLAADWMEKKNKLRLDIIKLFQDSLKQLTKVIEESKNIDGLTIDKEKQKRKLLVKRRLLETRLRFAVNKLSILGFEEVWKEVINLICGDLFVIRDLLEVVINLARQGYTDAIKQLRECYRNREKSEYIRTVILEAMRFLPSLDIQDWELIFELATEGISDIERLKATETWLYLGEVSKPYVQSKHIEAVVKALNSKTEAFNRLKKNYILILGMFAPDALYNISISSKENDDYIICDSLKFALEGKVAELFKEDEPAIIRQYYKLEKTPTTEDKPYPSLVV